MDAITVARRKRPRHDIADHRPAKRPSAFGRNIVRLAAHNGSVHRGEKRFHREIFGHEEKIDGAIEYVEIRIPNIDPAPGIERAEVLPK